MKRLMLREPTAADEKLVMDFRNEFLSEGSHIPGSAALGTIENYSEWLAHVQAAKVGLPERDLVASTQYLAFNDETDALVGCIQLRHSLNEYLANYGGHIGYSIRPSERRKGYGYEMLQACLEKAAHIGIHKALVTCDETNIASESIIRKASGVYEDTRIDARTGPKKRFWIHIP